MKGATLRSFLFNIHLYLGLVVAVFLVVASLTGSFLAFEDDYDRWLHPAIWQVSPAGQRYSQQELLDRVRRQLDAKGVQAPVEQIDLGGAGWAQVFALTDGRRAFVDPYRGTIVAIRVHPSKVEACVQSVHQLHVRLLAGNAGEWIVDIATLAVLLLVPSGVYLWWKKKRLTIKFDASGRRIIWDLHNVLGLYGCVLVFVMAATGLLLSFEMPLYWMVHSNPWHPESLPRSAVTESNVLEPTLDDLLAVADKALPGLEAYQVRLPLRSRSPIQVLKRGPGLAGSSTVYLDRYSGHILRIDDVSKLPRSYRAHLIDQAIHVGKIFGLPSRILFSFASLAFAVLVITGFLMWWLRVVKQPHGKLTPPAVSQ